jgi:DNA-binding transcriptional LysR family regulator
VFSVVALVVLVSRLCRHLSLEGRTPDPRSNVLHWNADMCQAVSSTFRLRAIAHPLLTSSWVCAMRRDHPLAGKKLTLERYAQAKHLLVTLTGESTGLIDPFLQERGLTRRIGLTVNQFFVAPRILVKSDLIAILPTRVVDLSGLADQLHLADVPIEIHPSSVKMMWHERSQHSPAQAWFRTQLVETCLNV